MTTKLVNGQTIDITGTAEETAILAEWADNEPNVGAKWLAGQAAALTQLRDLAKAIFAATEGDPSPLAKACRAFSLIVLDEFNAHAVKINAILTAIDDATTLAQVKSNIAAIADYPARTAEQLKQSIRDRIDAGDADS